MRNLYLEGSKLAFCLMFVGLVSIPCDLNAKADGVESTSTVDLQRRVTVTGVVKDAGGEPLTGATVLELGTTNGVITGVNGEYSLKIEVGKKITVSFVGYKQAEVTVGKSNVINIVMESDALLTDEVVVVGYGSMQKREVTSSITSIKNKDLIPGVASSPLMSMQGKVTGLSVVSTQGTDPNAGVSLQLRGANSVNASAGPLIVVDGVPGGNLNSIPREDIVSIDVLKDASAAAIYGTRASGGVVLVTTRQAKSGPVQVSYTAEFSTETIRKKADVLSPEEFVENGQGKDLGYKTDWFDLVTRTPFNQRHNLTLAGGTDKFNAYTSLNYKKAEGVAIGSDRQEIGARFNFNYKTLKDILEFQGNVSYTNIKLNRTNNDIFNQALKINPTQTAFDEKDLTGYNVWTGGYDLYNPLADIKLREDQGRARNLQASLTTKVNITKKLSTQLMIATKDNTSNDIFWRSRQHKTSRESGVNGYAKQSFATYNDITLDWLVNYKNTWNKHNFAVMAGYSFQEFNGTGFNAENQNFPVDGVTWNDMNSGSFLVDGRASMGSWKNPRTRLVAFFGRANYSFDDRYMITASARYEGSSKFYKGNQWGLFPSISAGWRISNEQFMKKVSWVNDLRLRAGWGRTGNEGFGAGKTVRMYGADSYWIKDGVWFKSYGLSNNVNPGLQWETKDEINIGLDFSLVQNRIYGKIDWYNRKSNNLIYDISVSQPPAVHDKTTMNAGSMTNTGVEFELSGVAVNTANTNYTTTLRFSHNKNTLNSLWGSQTYWDRKGFPAPGSPGDAVRLMANQKIGQFYLWKHAGFDEKGGFMIYNKKGEAVPASKKTMDDKQFVGNAIPKLMMSWDNSVSYKNWDFSAYFRAWVGFDVFNMPEMYYGLSNVKEQNVLRSAYGKNKEIKGDKELSDYWLEKGDFVKLDALTVGYNFNVNKIKEYVKGIRVYVTGRDLFCITGYSGFDPEININGLEPGFEERSVYPKTRTFLLGVQFNF